MLLLDSQSSKNGQDEKPVRCLSATRLTSDGLNRTYTYLIGRSAYVTENGVGKGDNSL